MISPLSEEISSYSQHYQQESGLSQTFIILVYFGKLVEDHDGAEHKLKNTEKDFHFLLEWVIVVSE